MPEHADPTSRTAADCSADDAAEAEVPGDIVRSEDPAAAREKDSSDQPPLSTLSVDEKSFTDFSVDVPNGVFGKGPWGIGWGAWFDSKNASALLPVALVLSFPVYAAVAAPWYAYVLTAAVTLIVWLNGLGGGGSGPPTQARGPGAPEHGRRT